MSAAFHEKKDLLERLAKKAGCAYLSDLHAPQWASRLQAVLEEVAPEQAGLEEWNEAVDYITGTNQGYTSKKEAREQLLRYVKKIELE